MRIDKNRISVKLPDGMSLFGDWTIDNNAGEAVIQINTSKVADAQKIEVQYDGAPEPPLSKTINVKEIQYTVTLMEGTNVISTTKVDKGKTFGRPSDPTKTGYTFVDWYNEAAFTTVTTFPITVMSDVTIYAKFNINSYTCKTMDGDTVVKTETLNYGTNWTPVQPDKAGFNKKGIYLDAEFNTVATLPIFVDEDKTVFLKYKDASIVTFYKDNYKLASDKVAEFSIDNGSPMNAVDIPAGLTYPNLTWVGWVYGDSDTAFNENVVINGALDVFGKWNPHSIHFDVTFDANGGVFADQSTQLKVRGTTNTALVVPSDSPAIAGKDYIGYNLDKLAIDPQHAPGTDVYPANGTPTDPFRTYYAIYKRTPGEVAINMMANDARFNRVTGTEGEPILLDGVPTRTGYEFREWAKNPQGDAPVYGANQNAVVWIMKLYDGGSLISSIPYFEGDVVTPEEPTKEGKRFAGWFREPTFQTRMTPPFTINRSIDGFAKFVDKVQVDITYKTADGKQTWSEKAELGLPYSVTNCSPYFVDDNDTPIIIHKWKYIKDGASEEFYPGQAFPHEVEGNIEFIAVPIAENVVKPEIGVIYLYGETDITSTTPKRKLYEYSESGLAALNAVPQEVATMIIKDYVATNGKAITLNGFKRVSYEQYSGPTSIYTIGDRLSQVGDTTGTFTNNILDDATKPTYVFVADVTVGANSALVVFDTAGGTPTTFEDQIIEVGAKIKDPGTVTKTNARFKGWEYDGKIIDLSQFVVPEGVSKLTLTASWQNSYEVQFDVNGGTPTIVPIRTYEGEIVQGVTTPTKSGYTFAGWSYEGNIIDITTWKVPIGGPTQAITATWTSVATVSFDGGGVIDPNPDPVVLKAGEVIGDRLPTVSAEGYTFNGWTNAGRTIDATWAMTDPAVDITFTAQWEERNQKKTIRVTCTSRNGNDELYALEYVPCSIYTAKEGGTKLAHGTSDSNGIINFDNLAVDENTTSLWLETQYGEVMPWIIPRPGNINYSSRIEIPFVVDGQVFHDLFAELEFMDKSVNVRYVDSTYGSIDINPSREEVWPDKYGDYYLTITPTVTVDPKYSSWILTWKPETPKAGLKIEAVDQMFTIYTDGQHSGGTTTK